jgi:hypothetical protein
MAELWGISHPLGTGILKKFRKLVLHSWLLVFVYVKSNSPSSFWSTTLRRLALGVQDSSDSAMSKKAQGLCRIVDSLELDSTGGLIQLCQNSRNLT